MLRTKKQKVAAIIVSIVDSNRMYAKPTKQIEKYSILEHLLNQIKTS